MMSFRNLAVAILLAVANIATAIAANLTIPNYSFEQPVAPPEFPIIPGHVSWQQTPKRADYVESPPFTWSVLTGVFGNTAAGQPDHIDNMDGAQAAYLFAETENGIFQELTDQFQTGVSYELTVAIIGSPNQPPVTGTTLALSLYYRDTTSAIVPISTTTVTFNSTTFPNGTHLIDFKTKAPASQTSAAWIGKPIGILIKSTAATDLRGGVWDLDNVRLAAVREFVQVPNFSFESPTVTSSFGADPAMTAWQKYPKPGFWDEATFGPWDNLTGEFINSPAGQEGHVDNGDRNQAAYLFGTGANGFFQDLTTPFEANYSYTLTVGLVTSHFQPLHDGSPLLMALYYRDAQNNMVPVASRTVIFNTQNFPTDTTFYTFAATSQPVASINPCLGKNIGVMFLSTAGAENSGGVWDVENVRVTASKGIVLRFSRNGNLLHIAWDSTAGKSYFLNSSVDLVTWTHPPDPLPGNGAEVATDVDMTGPYKFFTVSETP